MKRLLIVPCLAIGLAVPAEADYRRIGPGLELPQAQAYCELFAMQYQQGYYAYGSQSYVLGAALGNAIGNAIRMDQVTDKCMVLQGWEFYRPKKASKKLPGNRPKSAFSGSKKDN